MAPETEPKAATEETLFEEINKMREKMKLPKLELDTFLRNYSLEVLEKSYMPQIPVINETVYLSCFHILESLHKRTPGRYVEKWLREPSSRNVLLSPGNRGAVCMFSNPKDNKNYIAFFVATAFL